MTQLFSTRVYVLRWQDSVKELRAYGAHVRCRRCAIWSRSSATRVSIERHPCQCAANAASSLHPPTGTRRPPPLQPCHQSQVCQKSNAGSPWAKLSVIEGQILRPRRQRWKPGCRERIGDFLIARIPRVNDVTIAFDQGTGTPTGRPRW